MSQIAEPEALRARALLAEGRPSVLPLPDRGVEIGLLDWGGTGPLALLHHANGFCKGVFGLLVPALREHFHVVAMDARGHGDSSKPEGAGAYVWSAFAEDVVAVAEHLRVRHGKPLGLGLGHSFGGTSILGAAARVPDLFERLVLVDPVTPPSPAERAPDRAAHINGMSDAARRRRADWPTRAEAREWWAERSLFSRWQPEALDLYVLDGLREAADGSVVLKCPGHVEAAVFENGETLDVAALASAVRAPTLWLWAERGNFSRDRYAQLTAEMPDVRLETLASGHLAPMEDPDLVIAAIERFLAEPLRA